MKQALITLFLIALTGCQPEQQQVDASSETSVKNPEEVNIYSARKEDLMAPLLKKFTEETGIKVNIISAKADALLSRIQSEGINSPADVLLTTDAGRLHRAKSIGVLKAISSPALELIPAQYRDPDQQWFGLSLRARLIMLNDPEQSITIESYENLADPKYQGQICIRSSSNIYNQSLVASMLHHGGAETTLEWATGLVANLARSPQGGDTDQIRAAAAGQCQIAVANSYYLARILGGDQQSDDYAAANKIRVIWPNQIDRGTHVNISGAGVLNNAPNPENAVRLIEFLASDQAQAIYADRNFEYPVKAGIELNPVLKGFGEFNADTLSLSILGENNAAAVRLMDRAGWK